MLKTTLVVMTLNEIDGMKVIMPQIHSDWCDQIIISDGGSTDGTVEWSRKQGYETYVQHKPGIRYGYLEILDKIVGDIVISFSPDGNSPPEAIPSLINKMLQGYDLVIASRYGETVQSLDDDFITSFGNWLFTKTINVLHGGSFDDAMTIFRAFRRDLIYELDLDKEESYTLPEKMFGTTISWEPLMSVRAAKRKLRIANIPVGEPQRIGGERKLQIFRWGAAYYFQFWRELWFWKKHN